MLEKLRQIPENMTARPLPHLLQGSVTFLHKQAIVDFFAFLYFQSLVLNCNDFTCFRPEGRFRVCNRVKPAHTGRDASYL